MKLSLCGLGIRKAKVLNDALLMKLAWRYSQNQSCLRSRLLRHKYNVSGEFWSSKKVTGSSVQKSISHGSKLLQEGLSWRIGNGEKISFWIDNWCAKGPLVNLCIDNFNINWNLKVVDVLKDGVWELYSLLPQDLVLEVCSMPIAPSFLKDDKCI